MNAATVRTGARVPWLDAVLAAIASVSWALIGMAATAALGLRLLDADSVGELGPMTAAVVALGAGGSVKPSGDVSVFGLEGAEAATAIEIAPLGVGLVGALLLSWFFLRSLRAAGVVVPAAELAARAGAVVALFLAMLGGLAWAGHDVITIDGGALELDGLPGGGVPSGGLEIPGLGDVGDIGDIGGLLPDRVGDLVDAKAAVGFTVDTVPTLLGGACWVAGVLLIALLASRRTPLPARLGPVHRVVRPAVSALVTVLLVAVAAGWAAAGYAAIGDDHPRRIAGAALLGAPNGVWLGVPVGLFVPFDGDASGVLTRFLPDPLDDLLVDSDRPVTLPRLAELDGRVWLLGVAAVLLMLLAGVLTAVRTPPDPADPGAGALRLAGACALRLGAVSAVAMPLLALLAGVSVDASLSVLGFDGFGSWVRLEGQYGVALLLGGAWGAAAGAAGALSARAFGAAGRRAAPLALGDAARSPHAGVPGAAETSGPYVPGSPYRPPDPATNPYLRLPEGLRLPQDAGPGALPGTEGTGRGTARAEGPRGPQDARPEGPPGPQGRGGPEDGRSAGVVRPRAGGGAGAEEPETLHGAPTEVRPFEPPPRAPGRSPGAQPGRRPPTSPEEGPPPPPGPPPPRPPKGRR
ncbi:streptophobe family protein [Streptomyces sp. NPDC093094]|uniref:streptophobe family protein n=1 Tax=Streptomyces sp. NPDC093094 TaxID=3366026 RepID=UPI00381C0476